MRSEAIEKSLKEDWLQNCKRNNFTLTTYIIPLTNSEIQILLLGAEESGKSTIFKQLKWINVLFLIDLINFFLFLSINKFLNNNNNNCVGTYMVLLLRIMPGKYSLYLIRMWSFVMTGISINCSSWQKCCLGEDLLRLEKRLSRSMSIFGQ